MTFVVGRWGQILNGIGWIDEYATFYRAKIFATLKFSAAILFASYIRGREESTRVIRRNIVRYMVLSQALVLRDISMQVRKRFPTMDTLAAAGSYFGFFSFFKFCYEKHEHLGFMTEEEQEILEEIKDPYSRYFLEIEYS